MPAVSNLSRPRSLSSEDKGNAKTPSDDDDDDDDAA